MNDPPSESTQLSIIMRARQQQPEAWQRLVELYGPMVYTWARRWGAPPEDAADLMQDVFQTLTQRLGDFRKRSPNDSFRAWLYTITRRRVIDFRRRQSCRELALGGTAGWQLVADQMATEAPEETRHTELSGVRKRALALIQGDYASNTWQAFYRTAICGDAPADVAADLGVSVWAVYKSRARVLHRLKREFAGVLD